MVTGSGYWVWVMDYIDGYRSDLQLNDFTFNSDISMSSCKYIDGGNAFVYFETSVSGSGREMMLRTEKMTYTSSPTCSFSYALYSTTASHVGRTKLYWIEDAS